MKPERKLPPRVSLVRGAVTCMIVGLGCLGVFLRRDFSAWSVGIGVLAGIPLTLTALALYLLTVVRELRRHGEL
jgi:hypothetical protein